MATNQRAIGGSNNTRGNRYEGYFATYKILRAAHEHSHQTDTVRMREQAGCPVDDFVSQEGGKSFYHQLKADKEITWGARNRKLEKEFAAQKRLCESQQEKFQLVIVVSTHSRKVSLVKNMPADLANVTEVMHFPEVSRVIYLLNTPGLVDVHLKGICALRYPHRDTYTNILGFLYLDWREHTPDSQGYCVLSHVLDRIWARPFALIAFQWNLHPAWRANMEAALNNVASLEWWDDRGYLEYRCGNDRGAVQVRCDSPDFQPFAQRLIERQPKNFEEFEELL